MREQIKVGDKIARLTILELVRHRNRRGALVRCDCGTEKTTFAYDIEVGKMTSCGCKRVDWFKDKHTKAEKFDKLCDFLVTNNIVNEETIKEVTK
jgi:hypothetical protein